MLKGLLISHKGSHCGVYQFGRGLFETVSKGGGIDWSYAECASFDEAKQAVAQHRPGAILFNHHPMTMPWATQAPLKDLGARIFGLLHQVDQKGADSVETAAP